MHWIDDFLLDRVYQPICDALYDRVGNCTVLARSCLGGSAVFSGVLVGWRYWTSSDEVFLTIYLVSQMAFIMGILVLARIFGSFPVPRGRHNPLRIMLFPVRMFFVIALPIVSGYLFLISYLFSLPIDFNLIGGTVRDVLVISGLYFASCFNEPPMRTQWVTRLAVQNP